MDVPESVRVLVVRARAVACALPLDALVETMRPLPLQPAPGSLPAVTGLSLIRGEVVAVLDLGALLELPGQARPERYVLARAGETRRVALAVERIDGIRDVASRAFQALPPIAGGERSGPVAAAIAADPDLLLVLEAARLVPEEAWPELERAGAAR